MTKQKHFFLIRGLVREALHWHDFPDELLALFPGARLTTIDIPGAGELHGTPTPLSIAGMVELMRRKFAAAADPRDENVLVAVSLGGMIGTAWLKRHPEDFHRAVFINTSLGGHSPVWDRLKPSALAYLSKVLLLKGRAKEELIMKLVLNNEARYAETLELWARLDQLRPVSGANTLKQLLAAAFFSAGDFTPSVPVYFIGSTKDRMVNVDCTRRIANKWRAPLIEHPDGGHDLTSDDPKWVASAIHSFLISSSGP